MNKKLLLLLNPQFNNGQARKRRRIAGLAALLFLLLPAIVSASGNNASILPAIISQKDILISGVVKDKSGEAIPGVTVKVKGTGTVTTTNTKGQYMIRVPAPESAIVFSFIGYKTSEVSVGAQTTINVTLQEDATALNEVVVVNVGYGTVSKERLAGAVSSITSKDVADFPVSSVAEALAGKLAGVSVNTTEGAPGALINVTVRGGTSITQDNSPLFIVDGFPMDNALSVLSPNEIQSIDVLKDVASTSIYGSRGANGVFIITTKSGKKGRTVVSFDMYAGVRKITNYLEMMKPYDYVQAQLSQSFQHYNGYLLTDTANINGFYKTYGNPADFDIYKSLPAVNWQQRVFGRSALSNTQNLSINGGSDASIYSIIFNRYSEDGIMLASGLDRMFGSFRFENQVSKGFRVGVNARYSNQLVVGSGTSSKGSNGSILNITRYQPYDATSNLQINDPDANFDTAIDLSNPTTFATRDMSRGLSKQFVGSGFLSINILPSLTFRSNIGYTANQTDNKSFRGVTQFKVSSYSNLALYTGYPYVDLAKGNSATINNSNVLSYSKTLGKNHRVDVVVGQELNKIDNDSFTQNIQYFPPSVTWQSAFANVQQANPPPGSIQAPSYTNVGGERLFSYFGRVMYSYQNRYNLNLSFRRDGSSKFAENNRWSNFPSAQFAWRVSDESFYKNLNLNWMNGLKLRLSYGTAGNNRVNGDRLYATTFLTSPTAGGYSVTDNSQTSGYYSDHLANPDLKWESTVSKNIGLDIDLFNSRVTASVDVYSNTTNNLLLNTNIPQQTGYLTQFQNIGSTRNQGLEVQISSDIVRNKNFTYNASFNISFNRNVVLSLNQAGSSTYGYAVSSGWGNTEEDYYVQVGKPVGLFYGYVYDGFYKMSDFDRATYEASLPSHPTNPTWKLNPGVADASSKFGTSVYPGKIKLKDLDGDGVITSNDKTVIGHYQPLFYGGFNQQFRYKAFDMSVFMNYSYGNQTYNATKMALSIQYQVNGNNYPAAFANSFKYFDQAGNYITNWDQLTAMNANASIYAPRTGTLLPTSYGVEDASFLRITNVTLGYTLPAKLIERLGWLSKFRIYATVNNLYTFTKYTGYDPEASTRGTALTPGVDYSAYPRSRYILAGINLSF
ncbi:TonB-linked SusC/RagA family outer membrane protein [Mucilaginibacter yixingensis]|uniref:TonB-linked SusC/RagA family outer membrane protein n=1 Tax=Mucilaginibacter yixingensis TaxID=1295612 RepID=A0A2T5J930_9SPHI|nr:TonB-dependent receptor [Mucilaginibacter yixingensis]PTQ96566.1 TonB-linked SusC/RagA family outer membrane protein [Mucilaginibacter yixingensis]